LHVQRVIQISHLKYNSMLYGFACTSSFGGLGYSSGSSATAAAPRFEGLGFLGAVT
jgi:hypothetical protein